MDINRIEIRGRLGHDPRQEPDRSLNFSVATGESWKDKTTGETKEQTTWITCKLKFASDEVVASLRKGVQVHLLGSLRTWKNKEDNLHGAYIQILPWIRDHFICVDTSRPGSFKKKASQDEIDFGSSKLPAETKIQSSSDDDLPF